MNFQTFLTAYPIKKTCAFLFFIILTMLFSCKEEVKLWEPTSDKQVATDYIQSHVELSEFAKLLDVTGLSSLLSIRGPFTVMVPTNNAMFAFYEKKGVQSINEFDKTFQRSLVLNHIVLNELYAGDMGLGALRDTNAIGDFIVTEFQGADIVMNKTAKIIDRDVRLANGCAHIIDQVIEPITKDVYTVIAEDPGYSIFTEGLKLTGIKDTLQQIAIPYGKHKARTRFTVLAVPDSIYAKNGITNVNELIKWTGAKSDTLTSLNNEFYRYIEYHCLVGTYYLSDLNSKLYPVLSYDNNVLMNIDTDYKINYSSETNTYTSFIVSASNTPSKNGAIHAIDNLMPLVELEPQSVVFETTDFFDIKQGDYFGKYYMKWNDGENALAKIKFNGDFLGYYYKNHDIPQPLLNFDALFMLGYWWIEITFPKVMKGKYQIIYGSPWQGTASFRVYIDDVLSKYQYDGQKGGNQVIGEVEFLTTAEHRIRLEALVYDDLYWDFIQFLPIN